LPGGQGLLRPALYTIKDIIAAASRKVKKNRVYAAVSALDKGKKGEYNGVPVIFWQENTAGEGP
jgi:hypothetical protein